MLPRPPPEDDPRETRPPQNKKNELVRLQSEITREVTGDAPHIAAMVFGDTKDHPDVVGLPNAQIDRTYRDAFVRQDRTWLQAEARRDPDQFLKVAERIGVRMPDPDNPTPMHPAMAPLTPPAPPAPMAPPMPAPMPPPAMLAPPVMPQILGPNGQPLPPSGVV